MFHSARPVRPGGGLWKRPCPEIRMRSLLTRFCPDPSIPFTKSYSNGWNLLARCGNHSCKRFIRVTIQFGLMNHPSRMY